MNTWWNSADFALSLAFLLADRQGASTCRQIMAQTTKCRYAQVFEPRSRVWTTVGGTGGAAYAATWAATLLSEGTLLPVIAARVVTELALGFGLGVANTITESAEAHQWERRLKACQKVESRFASAAELYAGQPYD